MLKQHVSPLTHNSEANTCVELTRRIVQIYPCELPVARICLGHACGRVAHHARNRQPALHLGICLLECQGSLRRRAYRHRGKDVLRRGVPTGTKVTVVFAVGARQAGAQASTNLVHIRVQHARKLCICGRIWGQRLCVTKCQVVCPIWRVPDKGRLGSKAHD
eukprot:COSAG01_NODE_20330_length_959_cov_1.405814_1_plen_162_part_00